MDVQDDYAYVSTDSKLCVVNISDPAKPELAGECVGYGNHLSVYRDMLVTAEADSFTFFNVADPSTPTKIKTWFFTKSNANSKGITINGISIRGDYLIVAAIERFYDYINPYVITVDCSNPQNIKLLDDIEGGGGSSWSNFRDLAVQGDRAYVVDNYDSGISIYDISNKSNIRFLGSDWAWGYYNLDVNNNIAAITLANTLLIKDVSDPNNISEIGQFSLGAEYRREVIFDGNNIYTLALTDDANESEAIRVFYYSEDKNLYEVVGSYEKIEDIFTCFTDNETHLFLTGRLGLYIFQKTEFDSIQADFSSDTQRGMPPLQVHFINQSTGAIGGYEWDFGDGETSNEESPVHTYTAFGEYTVTLKVLGPCGDQIITKTNYINVAYDGNFINTAHIENYGYVNEVAVDSDGTVFLSHYDNGLRAFTFDGSSFKNTAHIDDGSYARGIAVGSDQTIFLANGSSGLRAYTYNSSSFKNTAHIDDGGYAWGIAVDSDQTIFLANDDDGLRAYTLDGNSFTNTAHINDGGYARGVVVGSDGTIFLANGDDGLRAYTYDGNSFTNTAHINDGGYARGIVVGSDGTIFLANDNDGLRAYIYDGSTFKNTAHIDNGSYALGIDVGLDGTIFLANDHDGLRAYVYDGTSLTNIAHIDDGGYALGVAVGSDGMIFLANDDDGLRVYTYINTATSINDYSQTIPKNYLLSQNYPNPFNPVTHFLFQLPQSSHVRLSMFDTMGHLVSILIDEEVAAGDHEVEWRATSMPSGVYFYRLETESFTDVKKCLLLK